MKRILAVLLTFVMIVGLCACTFDSQADFAQKKEAKRRNVPEGMEDLQDEYDALVNTITAAANHAFVEKNGGRVNDSFVEAGYNETLGYYAFCFFSWYNDDTNREHYKVVSFANAENVCAALAANEAENVELTIYTFQNYWNGIELRIDENGALAEK